MHRTIWTYTNIFLSEVDLNIETQNNDRDVLHVQSRILSRIRIWNSLLSVSNTAHHCLWTPVRTIRQPPIQFLPSSYSPWASNGQWPWTLKDINTTSLTDDENSKYEDHVTNTSLTQLISNKFVTLFQIKTCKEKSLP